MGALVGTPAYMAPEQLHGGAATARSDQFAFCVALYEALGGERPFRGDSLPALLRAVAAGLPAGERRLACPPWLEDALRRGLAPDPDERWPTMDALLDALDVDARARDSDEQRRQLRRVLLGLAPTPVVIWAAIATLPVADDGAFRPATLLAIWAAMTALIAGVVVAWWRAAFRPGTNRAVTSLMLTTLALTGVNRALGVLQDGAVAEILTHDLLFFAAFFAIAALFLDRRFLAAIVVPLAGIAAVVVAPARATDIFSATAVALIPVLHHCIRRMRPRAGPRPAGPR